MEDAAIIHCIEYRQVHITMSDQLSCALLRGNGGRRPKKPVKAIARVGLLTLVDAMLAKMLWRTRHALMPFCMPKRQSYLVSSSRRPEDFLSRTRSNALGNNAKVIL